MVPRLIVAALMAVAHARTGLRICTTPEPGFNEFTRAALTSYVAAGVVDPVTAGPKMSVGERGLIVQESDMQGYMHDLRELMFTGQNELGQQFDAVGGNIWAGHTYALHVFPSYTLLNYFTRTGFCDMGWGPVTVKPSRETCRATKCPATPTALTTVSLPEIANDAKVVPLANVTSAMSCCLDFPQTTVSTGMAVAFKKFNKKMWLQKPAVLNIFIILVFCIAVFAHVAWFFERASGNTNEFPSTYLEGIEEALWFGGVTIAAGCGDKSPRSLPGRLLTFLMFLGGIVLSSLFTAVITTELASSSATSDVKLLSDFSGKRMCSTGGYWNSDPLIKKNRKVFLSETTGTSMTECMEKLLAGKVDGVYYDRPPMEKMLLDKHARGAYLLTPDLLPLQLTPVFPDDHNPRVTPRFSAMKNEYDEQILQLSMDGKLNELYDEHFANVGKAGASDEDEVVLTNLFYALLGYCALLAILTFRHFLVTRSFRKAHPEIENHSIWNSTMGYIARHLDIKWNAMSAKVAAYDQEHKGVLQHALEGKAQRDQRRLSQMEEQLEVAEAAVAAGPTSSGQDTMAARSTVSRLRWQKAKIKVSQKVAYKKKLGSRVSGAQRTAVHDEVVDAKLDAMSHQFDEMAKQIAALTAAMTGGKSQTSLQQKLPLGAAGESAK
jgi:ABC-type amino acid transport substrate-binding protein